MENFIEFQSFQLWVWVWVLRRVPFIATIEGVSGQSKPTKEVRMKTNHLEDLKWGGQVREKLLHLNPNVNGSIPHNHILHWKGSAWEL